LPCYRPCFLHYVGAKFHLCKNRGPSVNTWTSSQLKMEKKKRKRFELPQVVQFVNNVFCIEDQGNSEVFQKKLISTQQILEIIKEFSSLFENRTLLSFARWCSTNKTSLLKRPKNTKIARIAESSFMLWKTYIMM
ncbi:hypothetical protein BDC45DRAFT_590770, partial [Circinella umbellata]